MTNISIVVSTTNKVCSWKSPDYFFYSASFFLNLHSSYSTEAFETINVPIYDSIQRQSIFLYTEGKSVLFKFF